MEPLNAQINLTDPAFPKISADQLLELEEIYDEMGENALDHNLCQDIAESVSVGNQTSLSGEQVHNWFQKRLHESVGNQLVDDEPVLRTGSSTVLEGKQGVYVSELEWTFEARSQKDLAWHDVATLVNFRHSSTGESDFCVRFDGYKRVDDEWVNATTGIRVRSVPLEPSKCHKIKDGDLVVCVQERDDYALYYDARVVRIQRRLHDATDCKCIFTVRFLHDNSEESINWKGVWCRPTQEESVVCHNFPEPTLEPTEEPKRPTQGESTKEEESVGFHNSQEPTKEPSLSDIENLWP